MLQYLYTYIMAHLPKSEKGQDLSEYGLLVALIAIVVLIAVMAFGQELSTFFNNLVGEVQSWSTPLN